MKHSEATIKKSCKDLLESMKIPYAPSPVYKGKTQSGRFIHAGKPGWPDYTAILPGTEVCPCCSEQIIIQGKFAGLEFKKSHGGKQSPEQKAMQNFIRSSGGIYLLVNSPRVLREYLEGLK